MKYSKWLWLFACLAGVKYGYAGSAAADINRSLDLRDNWQYLTKDVIFPVQWITDSHDFYYRKTVPGGFVFMLENADSGDSGPAFDHSMIAKQLSVSMGETMSPLHLPFDQFHYLDGNQGIEFYYHYHAWQCHFNDKCRQLPLSGQPKADGTVRDLTIAADNHLRISPDGKWQAHVIDSQIVVEDRQSKLWYQSSDGGSDNFYDPESIQWSPDSSRLLVVKVKPGTDRRVTRVLSSPNEQLQPEVVTQLYPKPGDKVDIDQPVLLDVNQRQAIEIDNSLFTNPYDLYALHWRDDSQSFSFIYTERGHQRAKVIEVSASTGLARALIDEQTDTFIYQWRGFLHEVNGQGKELIWLSERDGWAHLYLVDGSSGTTKKITQGQWPVRDVVKVDDKKRQLWFAASGMNEGEDPYFVHYYRINFDGSGLTEITSAAADHEVSFSDDLTYFVDVYSRVDLPNVAELRKSSDGKLIKTLGTADIEQLIQAGFKPPEPFVAKGRDNKSDIWGLIVKPKDFDPSKRYPVIENIYAGPHDSFVPKGFWPFGYHSGGDKVIGMQALADLGFIVVQIDGMGTANRSKAFHDVAWKNLGDSGFPDRIKWHQAAAQKYKWYNIDKGVGIYGASAGGQSTLGALVFHADFYTVGVAYAGCYDNRMDKMSWNEQWMGYPVDEHYIASSGTEHVAQLKGDLLIIVGEQDSNVDPASSLQLVDALIKADKDFDFLLVPGGEHSVGRSTGPIRYVQRRQFDFFVRHLLQKDTPHWNGQ